MAKEKFIRGKKDDCNHVGLYHNRRAEQAADAHLLAYLNGEFDERPNRQENETQLRRRVQSTPST